MKTRITAVIVLFFIGNSLPSLGDNEDHGGPEDSPTAPTTQPVEPLPAVAEAKSDDALPAIVQGIKDDDFDKRQEALKLLDKLLEDTNKSGSAEKQLALEKRLQVMQRNDDLDVRAAALRAQQKLVIPELRFDPDLRDPRRFIDMKDLEQKIAAGKAMAMTLRNNPDWIKAAEAVKANPFNEVNREKLETITARFSGKRAYVETSWNEGEFTVLVAGAKHIYRDAKTFGTSFNVAARTAIGALPREVRKELGESATQLTDLQKREGKPIFSRFIFDVAVTSSDERTTVHSPARNSAIKALTYPGNLEGDRAWETEYVDKDGNIMR